MPSLYVPIRIPSETNLREHWSRKHKRRKLQKAGISLIWRTSDLSHIKPPVTIRLTRIAPRSLDWDNLLAALKGPRDIIASLILPNLAPGQADDGHGIIFEYDQKKGAPKEYGLLIEVLAPADTTL